MEKKNAMKENEFEVKTVELEGSNLIEASAGTGKTYSIAILVIRLLLEKKIPIQEILMVTFTKAAVAELEERIRKFVRAASRYAHGEGTISESLIMELVDESIQIHGVVKVRELLQSAILNLDETSVMTIHSFCQQSLHEFAFETKQLFNAELVQDTSDLVEEAVQKFWRKNITLLPKELLKIMIDEKVNIEAISQMVHSHLNGKDFLYYDKNKKYPLTPAAVKKIQTNIHEQTENLQGFQQAAIHYIEQNQHILAAEFETNTAAKRNFLPLVDQPIKLMKKVHEVAKRGSAYVFKFPTLIEHNDAIALSKEKLENEIENFFNYIYSSAIQNVIESVNLQKLAKNILAFDDLIFNLHKALYENENLALENELRKKYKAVFIDEFQDTDRLQYEIFEKAFQGNSILFYIGDPKQSIYAWRKADISTYFKAKNKVEKVYGMNVNFRSTPALIEAMNHFFLPEPDFDSFAFEGESDQIKYIKVNAPQNSSKGSLLFDSQPSFPLTIGTFSNKDEIQKALVYQILDLLNNDKYLIPAMENGKYRRLRPSDIGILVRGKAEGKEIKNQLSKWGIPSVTVDDAKVLQSDEAKEVSYVLEAFLQHNRSNINRALMTNFIGWKADKIKVLDEEKLIEKFRQYHEIWKKSGVYTALKTFIIDFNIEQHLLNHPSGNGERIITNLFHLLEILYKTAHRHKLGSIELVDWLKVNLQRNDASEDEMLQRIESDEDAVNISTIHSSKGLQYPIVFAPTLDFTFYKSASRVYSFRDENGNYKSGRLSQFTTNQIQQLQKQEEQENRRLLYVALTRAVYKNFIYKSGSNYHKHSTLSTFLTAALVESDFIEQNNEMVNVKKAKKYVSQQVDLSEILKANQFTLLQNDWLRMSYSGLSANLDWKVKERFQDSAIAYDEFIFKTLKKGAKTGNFLHFVFENLVFNRPETWRKSLERAMKRFSIAMDDTTISHLMTLLAHVLQTEISADGSVFSMDEINSFECIHELEFDFPVGKFYPKSLQKLREEGIVIAEKFQGKIEGLMNGKIDLFFKNQGKYYVLDWKSNYLGPQVNDYSAENLSITMSENNYHLQYLIYSYAVKKYLESRLGAKFNFSRDFGGVIYLFVRGMRNGERSGIFYEKPNYKQMKMMEFILEKK